MLLYANSTTLSFRYLNGNFILNRPIASIVSDTFSLGCGLEGYAQTENNKVDMEVVEFTRQKFKELQGALLVESYRKQESYHYNDLSYFLIFKLDHHFFQASVFRSERGDMEILSAQRLREPEVVYSANYNYNLDSDFFDHYISLIGPRF